VNSEREIIIAPNRRWAYIPWRELWEYRDLLKVMVQRDFTTKYKQTVLGRMWFALAPLMTTIVFTIFLGKIAKIPTDGLPPLLFYFCNNVVWGYFSNCLVATSSTFVSHVDLFGKVYFPRLIVPLSKAVARLVAFIPQALLFAAFWIYYNFFTPVGERLTISPAVMTLPLLVVLMAAWGVGVGLWISVFTAKYRDIVFIMGFLTQLWMFATPGIVYPLSMVPQRWRWVVGVNPMSAIAEAFRYALLGAGTVEWRALIFAGVGAVFVLLSGVLLFNRTERSFIDTV